MPPPYGTSMSRCGCCCVIMAITVFCIQVSMLTSFSAVLPLITSLINSCGCLDLKVETCCKEPNCSLEFLCSIVTLLFDSMLSMAVSAEDSALANFSA